MLARGQLHHQQEHGVRGHSAADRGGHGGPVLGGAGRGCVGERLRGLLPRHEHSSAPEVGEGGLRAVGDQGRLEGDGLGSGREVDHGHERRHGHVVHAVGQEPPEGSRVDLEWHVAVEHAVRHRRRRGRFDVASEVGDARARAVEPWRFVEKWSEREDAGLQERPVFVRAGQSAHSSRGEAIGESDA